MNVERHCDRRSVVLMHDMLPLSEPTQRPERVAQFYTGNVWKVVLARKVYRPDLHIATIATPWTGLTMITGLDPISLVLAERYDEVVARFAAFPYEQLAADLDAMLNLVPNDWHEVERRLAADGCL